MARLLVCTLVLTLMAFAGIGSVHAQTALQTEGAQPYTPTRLQWLALKLNAELGRQFSQGGFQMLFVPAEKDNTILILVNYIKGTVPQGQIDAELKHAKNVIKLSAKARKWDSWLKVKEVVKATQ